MLSLWLAHANVGVIDSLFTYYTIVPVAFGGFCAEIRVRKLWKIWRCEIVLPCHLWLGLRPEYYVTVPPMMCPSVHCTSSWF